VIARPNVFTLKISDDERNMLELVARRQGESLSQTIRRLIRQSAAGNPDPRPSRTTADFGWPN
jgi:hypothetical protein